MYVKGLGRGESTNAGEPGEAVTGAETPELR